MGKKNCLLWLFLLLSIISYGQKYMKFDHIYYYDKCMIDSVISNKKCCSYVIYQTMLDSNNKFIQGEDEDKIATFLFWSVNDTLFNMIFTKTLIYKVKSYGNNQIFKYVYIDNIGADEKENNLKFVAPVLAPFDCDVVICKSKNKKFFFESGNVHLYNEDRGKYTYRKEYVEILREKAITNLNNLGIGI